MSRSSRIDPQERLRSCEVWQTNVRWPVPIDKRLEGLVERARDVGEALSRSDLLAALVLAAPESGEEIGELVRGYRRAVARDALIDGAEVIGLDDRVPGRRPRRKP